MIKSCCIADYCGMPYDISAPETRDTATLRIFWRQYCPKHRMPRTANILITEQRPSKSAVPCTAAHITWGPKGGQCMNCGGEGPNCYSVVHIRRD
jgi:hypothetical protein